MLRLFRAIGYYIGGFFSSISGRMSGNRHVMAATYDQAVDNSKATYDQAAAAVANLIGVEEERTLQVKNLTARSEKLTLIKASAAGKAKDLADRLKSEGKDVAAIKAHPDYIKHMAAYNDASSTLTEVDAQIDSKMAEIEDLKQRLAKYRVQLQKMQRATQGLKEEKQEALADMAIAASEQRANEAITGLAQNNIDSDLEKVRETRRQARNRAKVASEMAGNDAAIAEEEYLNYARQTEATSEFDALIGLSDEPTSKVALDPAKLPEEN